MKSEKVLEYPKGASFSVLGRVSRNGLSRLRTADGWVSEFSVKNNRRLVELLDPDTDVVALLTAAMGLVPKCAV